MATITSTSVDELLKNVYADWEIEQHVNLTYPVLASCAPEGNAQLGGNGFFGPARVESAHGHAYISETADLPAGRQTTVRQWEVDPTIHVGVVQLSGLSMAISSGNAMAFAQAFEENTSETIEAMSAYKEGVLFRDGSGIVATLNHGSDPGAITTLTLDDVAYLREGMVVDIHDVNSAGTWYADNTISEVDWVNKQVTFASAINAAVEDSDTLYMSGSFDTAGSEDPSSALKEPQGFEAAFLASGTYAGIPRATYPNWKSNVIAASGFFDETLLLRGRTRLTQKTGTRLSGMRNLKVVTHPMQCDILFKLAIPRIRYSGNEAFDLGNSDEVKFGGMPFETSYNAPTDKAYMGPFSRYFKSLYTPNGKLHVDTEYNGAALKWVATKDVGLTFVKEYGAFICTRPNAFVRYTGLSEQTR